MDFPRLFEPISVGKVRLQNRIVFTAHGSRLPHHRQMRYLEERIKNGIGMIIVGAAGTADFAAGPPSAMPDAYRADADALRPDPSSPAGKKFLDDYALPLMREYAELAHKHGVVCFAQLVHTGSYSTGSNWQAGLSPSAMPDEMLGETPHELSPHEIGEIARVYGEAAARVKAAGMDGVEVHVCHGLLLNSFLSPLTNMRTDQYGGSLENRLRFPREALESIRSRIGPDFPLGARVAGTDWVAGGLTPPDIAEVMRMLRPLIDYVNISGPSESARKSGLTVPAVPSFDYPQALYEDAATIIRKSAGVPVLLSGRITDPVVAERVISSGHADLIGMVRALIADPEWAKKVRAGETEEIRRCTGDLEGCRTRTLFRARGGGMPIGCTVNAAAGREEEMELVPAAEPRRVLVVGGGPGGMEAARVAALRGHTVTLCERGDTLGGRVRIAIKDPRVKELANSITYLIRQMSKLPIDVRLGTEVTEGAIDSLAPDAIILATGAQPLIPALSGVDGPNVTTFEAVLQGEATVGRRVVVVSGFDGYRGPPSLAELLADRGHQVEFITERMIVGESMDPGTNHNLQKRLFDKGVGMQTLTGLKAVQGSDVVVFNSLTRKERTIGDVDTVVLAMGAKADDGLHRALKGRRPDVYTVGDALAPRRVVHAVLEGSRAARAV